MGIREFLVMGGYAPFVWPAYGLTFIVLILNAVIPWRREKRLKRKLSKTDP